MPASKKTARERSGSELRERAQPDSDHSEKAREKARHELQRRSDNLRDGLIPEWEKKKRGKNRANWKLW